MMNTSRKPNLRKILLYFTIILVVLYLGYNIYMHSYLFTFRFKKGTNNNNNNGLDNNNLEIPQENNNPTPIINNNNNNNPPPTKIDVKVLKDEQTGKDQILNPKDYHPKYNEFVTNNIPSEYHPSSFLIAIVATKRPHYLEATLRSLQQVLYYNRQNTFIYQYGDDKVINQIARKYSINMVHNPILTQYEGRNLVEGAEHISLHYKFILGHVFENNPNIKHFIIVEDDMLFAPDFLLYFSQTAKYLHEDSSIYAISAYNDNGMKGKAKYDNLVYRTDFFIGLGWLVSRNHWMKEWKFKWPRTHWDHFLRADQNRQGRQIIYPEVPRIYHSGYTGTHSTVALYERYFRNHLLNPNGFSPLGISKEDFDKGKYKLYGLDRSNDKFTLEYLRKDNYNEFIKYLITKSPSTLYLKDPYEITKYTNRNIVFFYEVINRQVNEEWVAISEYFELWHSIPIRDEYDGVMHFRWADNLVIVVASYSPFYSEGVSIAKRSLGTENVNAPISEFKKEPNWETPKKPSIIDIGISNVGQSCSSFCKSKYNLDCYRFSFEELNSCKYLKRHFGSECKSCGPQTGPDQPAIDNESKECYYNTGKGRFMTTCEASHPRTKRLCPCFDENKTIILRQEWEDIIAQSQKSSTEITPIIL
ncbi:hypothetical protein ABK040_003492 [Willaertia magna]